MGRLQRHAQGATPSQYATRRRQRGDSRQRQGVHGGPVRSRLGSPSRCPVCCDVELPGLQLAWCCSGCCPPAADGTAADSCTAAVLLQYKASVEEEEEAFEDVPGVAAAPGCSAQPLGRAACRDGAAGRRHPMLRCVPVCRAHAPLLPCPPRAPGLVPSLPRLLTTPFLLSSSHPSLLFLFLQRSLRILCWGA